MIIYNIAAVCAFGLTIMNFLNQIKLAMFDAPIALNRMTRRSYSWAALYTLAAILVFGLIVWSMISHQDSLKTLLLDYLFPKSWHAISEQLANFLFESQTKIVLSNMILSGSLVLASITLFPLKEKYSAAFEKSAGYQNGTIKEFPLTIQAWEEIKLFLLYLTAQSLILWIGYYPFDWSTYLSNSLSYLFLFFTFGLDIIAPTLQRHRTNYSVMLKYFLGHPLLPLSFGLLFSLPLVVVSHFIFMQTELSFIEITSRLFLINILFLSLAIPAGTHLASKILAEVRNTKKPARSVIKTGYISLSILLVVSLFLHSRLLVSLHHKSQLLKAEYDIDWSSASLDIPSMSQLTNGQALSNFSIDAVISNPTEFNIVIEPSELHIKQLQKLVAKVKISGFDLPSGHTKRITLNFDSDSDLSQVTEVSKIFEGWNVDMYVNIWPGIPLILNIIEPDKN